VATGAKEPKDVGEYCREIETYLCRKNEGHLIRIVGPAFDQVCGWAQRGVPLQIAFRGIDRYCERYYTKGPRRRPVRIEFCEADVLDVFDDWRRAVGVSAFSSNSEHPQRKPSLASHIERAIAKLVAVRTEGKPAEFVERLGEFVRELDALLPDAQRARGDRRAQIVARLDEIDRQLLDLAREQVSQTSEASLRRDAAEELAPFASRMPADAYEKALELAFSRLVRQAVGLPVVSFE
jgi:hypothetical protein